MGLNRRTIRQLVDRGIIVRIVFNGYVSATHWSGLGDSAKAVFLLRAHSRASRSDTRTYSHTSAARIHQLSLWRVDSKIHITQPFPGSSRDHSDVVMRHSTPLPPEDAVTVHGMRVTSLARTTVDCARLLTYRQGLILADHARRVGATRADLEHVVRQQAGFKGVQVARRVVADSSPLSESAGETLTRHLLTRLPIPQPEQQVVVHTAYGEHRLDFGWREQKLGLEFDGKTKYFDFAPTSEVVFQERRREKALREDGWEFVRLEWSDLFKEEATRARILRVWSGRRRSAA
jgi:very-short-patch-repair endonuclease